MLNSISYIYIYAYIYISMFVCMLMNTFRAIGHTCNHTYPFYLYLHFNYKIKAAIVGVGS